MRIDSGKEFDKFDPMAFINLTALNQSECDDEKLFEKKWFHRFVENLHDRLPIGFATEMDSREDFCFHRLRINREHTRWTKEKI